MAVYTEVSFEELERLLEQYDIGQPLSFKGIAEGIENSNFYLQTDRGAFILTRMKSGWRRRICPSSWG
jgi:homoserine kinase type II